MIRNRAFPCEGKVLSECETDEMTTNNYYSVEYSVLFAQSGSVIASRRQSTLKPYLSILARNDTRWSDVNRGKADKEFTM